jgi:hypothetical protein
VHDVPLVCIFQGFGNLAAMGCASSSGIGP